jgi:hypothetical protein
MGMGRIYSKLDQEAQKAFQDYRLAIGLAPVAVFERPQQTVQIGAWVDGLALWNLFVTTTYRWQTRRWKNPAGFAALETGVAKGAEVRSTLCSGDFTQRLASHTPAAGYVQRFFYGWIEGLTQKLLNRVDYFVGFEAGTQSGANHFHALLAADGLHDYSRKELWQELFKSASRSLVLPFDPGRGAGWYVAAAYVGKKQLGWDVSVGNRALIQSRPAPGGGCDVTHSSALPRDSFHSTLGRWHR